jgi:thiol-disulfide isomerase/thioredoxin
MSSLALAAIVLVSFAGSPESDLDRAVRQSVATGRPLVLLLGADWCPACQVMQNSTLPRVAKGGGLDNVVFVYIDVDRQRELASQLSQADSIPQLLRFDPTPSGWQCRLLVGARSPEEVDSFVNAGLPRAADERYSAHSVQGVVVSDAR